MFQAIIQNFKPIFLMLLQLLHDFGWVVNNNIFLYKTTLSTIEIFKSHVKSIAEISLHTIKVKAKPDNKTLSICKTICKLSKKDTESFQISELLSFQNGLPIS